MAQVPSSHQHQQQVTGISNSINYDNYKNCRRGVDNKNAAPREGTSLREDISANHNFRQYINEMCKARNKKREDEKKRSKDGDKGECDIMSDDSFERAVIETSISQLRDNKAEEANPCTKREPRFATS